MPGNDRGTVSVIILNWNGKDLLSRCLETLRANTAYEDYHTVVVDNASTDGSVELVRREFGWVHLVENETNLGVPGGYNAGIEYAIRTLDPDYVLVMNNDLEFVQPEWLDRLVESVNEPGVGIVGCKLLYPDGTIQHAGDRVGYFGDSIYREDVYREPTRLDRLEFVLGACFLIDRGVVDTIGLWDEGFSPTNWGERDYCMRARAAGYDVLYDPRVTVIHHEGKDKEGMQRLSYVHKKNQLRFMLLNFDAPELVRRIPIECRQLIGRLVQRDRRQESRFPGNFHLQDRPLHQLQIYFRAYLENISNIRDILSKRRDRTRKIGELQR